jgi:hypothetical protein
LAADINLDRLVFGKRDIKCRWQYENILSGPTDMHGKYKVLASSALLNPDISLHPSEGTTTQGKGVAPHLLILSLHRRKGRM